MACRTPTLTVIIAALRRVECGDAFGQRDPLLTILIEAVESGMAGRNAGRRDEATTQSGFVRVMHEGSRGLAREGKID